MYSDRNGHAAYLNLPAQVFYREVIGTHSFQNMLDVITVPGHRAALVRLICSSHRLYIETGRWSRPKITRNERKCATCNKIDDEYHFLLECSTHSLNRIRFIKKYYRKRPSMSKCIQMMATSNKKELRNLAKYVYTCFKTNST